MRGSAPTWFTLVALAAGLSGTACVSHSNYNPPQRAVGWSGPNYNVSPGVYRPVNVAAIGPLQGRVRCAPREVAPGEWARFDCSPHRPVVRALAFSGVQRRTTLSLTTGGNGGLPDAVDHRADGTEGPIKSQGAVGACTAFSLSSTMDNAIRRLGRQDTISPLHVWSKYAIPVMGVAGDETVDSTLTLESSWPYDPVKACKITRDPTDSCRSAYGVQPGSGEFDPQLRGERALADTQGRYKLLAVEQLHAKPADINELSSILASGDDVWASFYVDERAWDSRSLNNGVIPDYQVVDEEGHAVSLAGYRTTPNGQKQFLVHNSWGVRWGEGGFGWLSEAMVSRYMRSAYRIRVGDPSSPNIPTPNAGGCAQGQVRDSVLGSCSNPCSSGSAPAAGVCLPTLPGGAPMPGIPGLQIPGLTLPGQAPPANNACASGQVQDMMTGQCSNPCAGGGAPVGGMCLPIPH
jgi:hypothetical protein